jgi:hypothetical protein
LSNGIDEDCECRHETDAAPTILSSLRQLFDISAFASHLSAAIPSVLLFFVRDPNLRNIVGTIVTQIEDPALPQSGKWKVDGQWTRGRTMPSELSRPP